MSDDKQARAEIERHETPRKADGGTPAAGPHAKPELTDKSKTPGAGSLPDEGDTSVDPGAG